MTNEEFMAAMKHLMPACGKQDDVVEHARKLVAVAEAAKALRAPHRACPKSCSGRCGYPELRTTLAQLEGASSETSDEGDK